MDKKFVKSLPGIGMHTSNYLLLLYKHPHIYMLIHHILSHLIPLHLILKKKGGINIYIYIMCPRKTEMFAILYWVRTTLNSTWSTTITTMPWKIVMLIWDAGGELVILGLSLVTSLLVKTRFQVAQRTKKHSIFSSLIPHNPITNMTHSNASWGNFCINIHQNSFSKLLLEARPIPLHGVPNRFHTNAHLELSKGESRWEGGFHLVEKTEQNNNKKNPSGCKRNIRFPAP